MPAIEGYSIAGQQVGGTENRRSAPRPERQEVENRSADSNEQAAEPQRDEGRTADGGISVTA